MESDRLDALTRWRTAFELEARLRDQMNRAMEPPSRWIESTGEWQSVEGAMPSGEDLRQWWSAVEGVWREFSRQVAAGYVPDPQPEKLASIMADLCGFLAVGQLPEPMRDSLSEGRRRPAPHEKRDIQLAVAYHNAAKGRLKHNGTPITVNDRTPTKTLSDHYGVSPGAVRGWIRTHVPAFLGITDADGETIVDLMKAAAVRYRVAGRSVAALTARASKRKPHTSDN